MKCLERFDRKMKCNGNSLREEYLNNSRFLLDETFSDDTSFTSGIYIWKLGLKDYSNEIPIKIRFYDRKFSNANGLMVDFHTLFDTKIDFGDIIFDSNNDEYWICTESFNINNIHWQGKFTFCNWILKWQKKDTGEILEYPCYDMNSTQYNSGETPNKIFTIATSQHQITLPYDENTVALDTPQRFYLDRNVKNPTPYIITQNDTTSYAFGKKGLVKVTVAQHTNDSETDRPDLGICDYIEINNKSHSDSIVDNKRAKVVIEYDTDVIKSGGDTQYFIGKFYDDKGVQVSTPLKWDIICDFYNELEITESDNLISISINNDDYIDDEFKIVLTDLSGKYTDSLIVRIDSLL